MVGVAADGLGGQSELFEVKSGREIPLGGTNPQSVVFGLATNNSSLSFTSDSRFVIAAPGSGGVTPVFDAATGALVRTLKTGPPSLDGFSTYADTSPNPKVPLLAVAVNTDLGNGRVEIWNTRTWKEEFVLTTTSNVQYRGLAFSPDGDDLAVAETNGFRRRLVDSDGAPDRATPRSDGRHRYDRVQLERSRGRNQLG